jgi:CheY-like chemotaxis protein
VISSVLVVDDDPEFRKLAGRLLAAWSPWFSSFGRES